MEKLEFKNELLKLLNSKLPGAKPLLLVIRGSHAYGTNIETSDYDFSGVYIQSQDDILGFGYREQINDDGNDIVLYEIRRFLELISVNNPTILELLNTPGDCIIYKDPVFDIVLNNRHSFITKQCAKSFGGYATQQIKKARGLNKKQNWEMSKVERKNPMDFCFIHQGEYSKPLTKFLIDNKLDQKFCGLSKIPHSRDLYSLFYDRVSHNIWGQGNSIISTIYRFFGTPLKFRGISFEDSNELRLSNIPKGGGQFIGYISYNKDAYIQHCRDFREYSEWLSRRNTQRWVDVKSHGQMIDGKNMMHSVRLMDMAIEIGSGMGIIVKRPDAQKLLDIRRGLVDLDSLIDSVEHRISEMDEIFHNSDLPDSVDQKILDEILINIRREHYNNK